MILSCFWIFLPCLSRRVFIRVLPRLCVLLTFFKLLDTSSVSRMLCFRMSSLDFFTVLHISAFYVICGVLFSNIYLRFFIRTRVTDDIFGFFCFLVYFAMLVVHFFIVSVMFLLRVSISSHASSTVDRFFSSSWSVFFFVPIIWVSTLVKLSVSLFRSFLLSALVFSVTGPMESN